MHDSKKFLNVNSELAGLAKVGPIRTQANSIMTLLRSPRTAVHLVTVLEDMPVQETADGIAELNAAKLPVGGVVVNLVRSNELDDGARDQAVEDGLPRGLIEEDLRRVGIEPTGTMLDGLLTEVDVAANIPDVERYTYLFDQNAEQLDHMFVSPAIAARGGIAVEHVHVNNWAASLSARASDHDPSVAQLKIC